MSATQPTRRPWHSVDDGIWANAAGAGDTESAPSNGEKDAGALNGTGLTSGRFNWLMACMAEWFQRVRDTLLPQHTDAGKHTNVVCIGTVDTTKLQVAGTGADAGATYLTEWKVSEAGAQLGYMDCTGTFYAVAVGASGAIAGATVSQTDTTNRTEVTPGLAGFLVSSGTRVETGAGLGYDENDATTRTIRYWAPKMPEHAILRSVKVITTPGHTANVVNAELWETDNATNSTKTSHGTITAQTGVTGNQSATVAISGTLTQAGARGWWIDVAVSNNDALGVYVNKIVWDYDITRF